MSTEEKLEDSVLKFVATHGEGGESLHVDTTGPTTFSGTAHSHLPVKERAARTFDPSCKYDVSSLFEINVMPNKLEPLSFYIFFSGSFTIIYYCIYWLLFTKTKGDGPPPKK